MIRQSLGAYRLTGWPGIYYFWMEESGTNAPTGETPVTHDLAALNDFTVLVFRLFGVNSAFRSPLVSRSRNPWDWGRPWLCDSIRRMPGMFARCDAAEAALCRAARVRPALRQCHAGLEHFAIPLFRCGHRVGYLICAPVRAAKRVAPVVHRLRMKVGDLGYDPQLAGWAVEQIPVLPPRSRHRLSRLARDFMESLSGESGSSFGRYHYPVRGGEDGDAWLSFLWAGCEKTTNEPPSEGWLSFRNHDVLLWAMGAPVVLAFPGRVVTLKRGQAMIIPGGARYNVRSAGESPAEHPLWIHYVSSIDLAPMGLRPFRPPARVLLTLRYLAEVWNTRSLFDFKTEEKLRTLDMLLELGKRAHFPSLRRGRLPRPDLLEAVEKARRYIEAALNRRVTLEELSRIAGVNVFTLCHRFRQEIGSAPLKYHRQMRVREAGRLLHEGGTSVKAVAYRLGFSDQHHFRRVFKDETGISPNEARLGQHPPN